MLVHQQEFTNVHQIFRAYMLTLREDILCRMRTKKAKKKKYCIVARLTMADWLIDAAKYRNETKMK